ncbi:MAG: hypothetical protein ABS939_00025 [Psychrobacillus sp.]
MYLDTAKIVVELNLKKHEVEDFLHLEGHCKILLSDDDDEVSIGYINFSLYHLDDYIDELDEVPDLLYEVDEESEDKNKLVKDFLHYLQESDRFHYFSFITIDTMEIKHEFRNRKFGSMALKEFLELVRYMNVQYIILQPAPIEQLTLIETRNEKIITIAKFYEKSGFKCYQADLSKNSEPIMIYSSLDDDLNPNLFSSSEIKLDTCHDIENRTPRIIPPEYKAEYDKAFSFLKDFVDIIEGDTTSK